MASAPLENVDEAVRRAGDRTPDEQNVLLGVHTGHHEILDGERLAAHATRQTLALDDARRAGRRADRPPLGSPPMRPGNPFPLRRRAGDAEEPIEPGSRPIVGPCDAVPAVKPWRLITPPNPRPFVTPSTSTDPKSVGEGKRVDLG